MGIPTLIKQPSENRLYTMEFSGNMAESETITGVNSVTVTPAGLTLSGSASFSGTQVTQRILGGVDGVLYKVTFIVTTSAGNILEGEGFLRVQDL